MKNPEKKVWKIFAFSLGITAFVEFIIMLVIEWLELPKYWEIFIDVGLLVVVLVPIILTINYKFIFKQIAENELFSLIMNGMSDIVFLMEVEQNQKFRCILVNHAYLKVTRIAKEQIIGRYIEEILPKEKASFVIGKYKEAVYGKGMIKYEEGVELPIGLITVETTLIPIHDQDGKCTHLLGIAHDISRHKEVEESLRRLSLLDGLTGIANRRHFDEKLQQEIKRSLRHETPLSLLMVDIDHFKRYNDTYGHQAGDDCLIKVARTLNESLKRSGDLVARYGGEEFVVILPYTDEEGAMIVAEKLRSQIDSLKIPHVVNQTVTISIGAATLYPTEETNPQEMIDKADKALYQAKLAGRNRVKAYTFKLQN